MYANVGRKIANDKIAIVIMHCPLPLTKLTGGLKIVCTVPVLFTKFDITGTESKT